MKPEVEDEMTTFAGSALSRRASSACFKSSRSRALSCTKSHPVTARTGSTSNERRASAASGPAAFAAPSLTRAGQALRV